MSTYTTASVERTFQTLVENAADVIGRFDHEHRCLYVNPAVTAATGRAPSDFIGRTLAEFEMPADLVNAWTDATTDVFASGCESTVEFTYGPPNGLPRWFRSRIVPEFNDDGAVESVVVIARDITEARAADEARIEAARQESIAAYVERDLFAAAIYNVAMPVAIMAGEELRYTFVNPAYQRLAPGANMIGRTFNDIFPSEERVAEAKLRHVLATGEPWFIQRYVAPANVASRGIWEGEAVRLRAPSADDPGSIGIFIRDVEDQVRAEYRVRRLVDSNIIGVAIANENTIIEANDAFKTMLGFVPSEIEASNIRWREMTPAEHLPKDATAIQLMLTTGTCPSYEKELIRKDGSRVPILLGASVVNYEPLEWVAFVMDLTEAKRVEAERNTLLEAEKGLRAEAEQAADAKGRLLAAVSHELRTPLTTMSGWLQVLEGDTDAELRGLAFRSLRTAVATQKRMVDDLLDEVRLTRGALPLDIDEVNLSELLGEVAETLRPVAVDSGLTLLLTVPESIPLRADRGRIAQVVANLMSNAFKFTPAGGSVHVRGDLTDGYAIIAVTDTGYGINPEFLPHVFETFSQGRKGGQGLGLGLSIVRDIVEQHGGTVTARSDGNGKGSTFEVRLPLARRAATAS